MNNFDFRSVDFFLKVAETLNFSRAAEELYISQPALSKCIRNFEKEIGVKLFDRSTKHVELTDGGAVLYDVWARLRDETQDALITARRLNGTDIPKIRIGLLEFGGVIDTVSPFLEEYQDSHPEIELSYEIFGFTELKAKLKNRDLDLIINLNTESEKEQNEYHVKLLKELSLYIIVSDRNHFFWRDSLDFSELCDETFLIFENSYSDEAKRSIMNHCREKGFTPKKIRYFPNMKSMEAALIHSDGITIGYDIFFSKSDSLKFFPTVDAMGTHTLIFSWRGELSKHSTQLMNFLETRLQGSQTL